MKKKRRIFVVILLSCFCLVQASFKDDPYSLFGTIKDAKQPHFLANGKEIAVIQDNAVIVYELKEGLPEFLRFSYEDETIKTFTTTPRSRFFAVYSEGLFEDTKTLRITRLSEPPRTYQVDEPLSSLQFFAGPVGNRQGPHLLAKKGKTISAFNYIGPNATWLTLFEDINFTNHFCSLGTHLYMTASHIFYDRDLTKFPDDPEEYPDYLPFCDDKSRCTRQDESSQDYKGGIFPVPLAVNEKANALFMSQKKDTGRGRPILLGFKIDDKCFDRLIDMEMHFDYVVSQEETICLAGDTLFIFSDKGSQTEKGDFVDPDITEDAQFIAAYDYDDNEVKIWRKNTKKDEL